MKQMTLKDGMTTINLIEANCPKHFVAQYESAAAFQRAWNSMTDENVLEICVFDNGQPETVVVGSRLAGTQTVNLKDGSIIGHFYLENGICVDPAEYYTEDEDPENGELAEEDVEEEPEDPEKDPEEEPEGEPVNEAEIPE